MKNFIRCVIVLMVLPLCFCADDAWAVRIVLDGGRIVEGEILEYTDEFVKIKRADKSVLRIRFSSMGPLSAQRLKKYIETLETQKPVLAPEEDPNEMFSQAADFAKKGEPMEALRFFNRAVFLDPENGKFLFFRGNLFFEMGNFQKAVDDYKAASAVRPDKPNIWVKLAETYMQMELFTNAVEAYDEALDLTPRDLSVTLDRANARWKNADLTGAIYDYTTVLKADKSNGYAYGRRAKMYFDQGEYRLAWKDVYSAQGTGFRLPDAFIEKMQQAMPDPFRERTTLEKIQDLGDWVVETARQYSTVFAVASGFVVFGIAMLLIMLLKTSQPKLRHAAEGAGKKEREERMESSPASLFETGDFKQAPPAKRLAALLIDVIVFIGISYGVDRLLGTKMFFVWFGILFLARDFWKSRSLGKCAVGLVVVNEFGYRGTFWENLVRNFFLAFISCLAFLISTDQNVLRHAHQNIGPIAVIVFFLFESVCLLLRKDRFRIGDIMAATCIHDRHPERKPVLFFLANIILISALGAAAYWGYETGQIELVIKPRYQSEQFEVSFNLPAGWNLKEEAGSIVLEKLDKSSVRGLPQATMMLSRDPDMALFSVEQSFEAFQNYLKSMGMKIAHQKDENFDGRTVKILISSDARTQDAVALALWKQFEYGPLYILQCNVKLPQFKDVASVPFLSILESLRFLGGKTDPSAARKK